MPSFYLQKSIITSAVRSLLPLNGLLTKLWLVSCIATYLTPASLAGIKWKINLNYLEIAEVIVTKNVPLRISDEFPGILEKEEYCVHLQHYLISFSRASVICAEIRYSLCLVTVVGRDLF